MGSYGMFVKGIFCGFNVEERENDYGVIKKRYQYLIADGADPFTITCDKNYSDILKFGDEVCFRIAVRAWNNRVFINGELFEE